MTDPVPENISNPPPPKGYDEEATAQPVEVPPLEDE